MPDHRSTAEETLLAYKLSEEVWHDFTMEFVSNFNDWAEQNCECSVPLRAISSLQTNLFLKRSKGTRGSQVPALQNWWARHSQAACPKAHGANR